jgi:2-haloacid dehalogenase
MGAVMPTAVFDMLGTFFSLEPLRRRLEVLRAPKHTLELWFAESLRDFFATSHAGGYEPLARILADALPRTLAELGHEVPAPAHRQYVLEGLQALEPAQGAAEACALLTGAGWKIIALTNGGEDSTRALLGRAGLLSYFDTVLSTDSIRLSKPHPDVYAMARAVAEGDMWMVAAHAWDLNGARRSGMRTAWISRKEKRWLDFLFEPDVQAEELAGAAREMLARARTGVEPTAPPFMPVG